MQNDVDGKRNIGASRGTGKSPGRPMAPFTIKLLARMESGVEYQLGALCRCDLEQAAGPAAMHTLLRRGLIWRRKVNRQVFFRLRAPLAESAARDVNDFATVPWLGGVLTAPLPDGRGRRHYICSIEEEAEAECAA